MHDRGTQCVRGCSREPWRSMSNLMTLSHYCTIKEAEATAQMANPHFSLLNVPPILVSALKSEATSNSGRRLTTVGTVLGKNKNPKEYDCFRLECFQKVSHGRSCLFQLTSFKACPILLYTGDLFSPSFQIWWLLWTLASKYLVFPLIVSAMANR